MLRPHIELEDVTPPVWRKPLVLDGSHLKGAADAGIAEPKTGLLTIQLKFEGHLLLTHEHATTIDGYSLDEDSELVSISCQCRCLWKY